MIYIQSERADGKFGTIGLWPYTKPFDFIHARTLSGYIDFSLRALALLLERRVKLTFYFRALRDWPALYGQAFHNLKPGGWVEATDSKLQSS